MLIVEAMFGQCLHIQTYCGAAHNGIKCWQSLSAKVAQGKLKCYKQAGSSLAVAPVPVLHVTKVAIIQKSPSPHLQSSKTARHHSCNHPKKPSASSGACISATLTAMPYLTIHCPLPGIVSAPFLQWQEHLPLCLGCCLPSSSGAEQCLSPAARLCCHLAPPAPAQAICWLRIFRSKAGLHDNMNPSVHCVVHELPMHFEKLTHKALHVLKHITHFVTDHR